MPRGRPLGSHSSNVFAKSVATSLIGSGMDQKVIYSSLKNGFESLAGVTSEKAHSRAVEVLTEVLHNQSRTNLQNDLAEKFGKMSGESFVPAKPKGRKPNSQKK